jgi:hypothetical protein
MKRWFGILVMGAVMLAACSALANTAEEEAARKAAIDATTAAINQELKEIGGGSWEQWAESLKEFRADLKGKQPKHGFRFRGADTRVVMVDNVEQLRAGKAPYETIVSTHKQLKERGIDLIVMFIPDKLATYPDYLANKVPEHRLVAVQMKRFIKELNEAGVEAIDLYTIYRDTRRANKDKEHIFYNRDSHWRNYGARIAAKEIAERLKRYDFVKQAMAKESPYTTEMFHRNPGESKEDDVMLIKRKGGGGYKDAGDSPIILTTDSYGMYNMHLKSHLTAQVAYHIHMPLTFLCKEGLWGNMPVELARRAKQGGYLEGRRVVIWTMIARCLTENTRWQPVMFPAPATP